MMAPWSSFLREISLRILKVLVQYIVIISLEVGPSREVPGAQGRSRKEARTTRAAL
jgi:hypothetical protein